MGRWYGNKSFTEIQIKKIGTGIFPQYNEDLLKEIKTDIQSK